MASHSLSGLTGTKENHLQGPENSIRAGNSPTAEGLSIRYDGPGDHLSLLEYYFGHPSSTVKSSGAPKQSRW